MHRAVYLLFLKYHMPVNTSKTNLIIVTAPASWPSTKFVKHRFLSTVSCLYSAIFQLLFRHFSLLRKHFVLYLISFYWILLLKHSSISLNTIISLFSKVFTTHPNLCHVQLSIGAGWEVLIQYFPPVFFRSETLAGMIWFCGAFQFWQRTDGSIETSLTSFPYESHISECRTLAEDNAASSLLPWMSAEFTAALWAHWLALKSL